VPVYINYISLKKGDKKMGGTAIDFSPQRRRVYFLYSKLFAIFFNKNFQISIKFNTLKTMIGIVNVMKIFQRVGSGVNP
jgi:hypothetical protein